MPSLSRAAGILQTIQPESLRCQSGAHMAPLLGRAHTEYDFATANHHYFSQHILSQLCMFVLLACLQSSTTVFAVISCASPCATAILLFN